MKISKLKMAWKFLTGGSAGVADYALDVLNGAMGSLAAGTKEKVRAALNLASRVLAILEAVKWLIPTKWQTAYMSTIDAVTCCVGALADLEITEDELASARKTLSTAVEAWKAPDDDTCRE